MECSTELWQLAQLLRLGANTARQIASIRQIDERDICSLADRADEIAVAMEAILKAHAGHERLLS